MLQAGDEAPDFSLESDEGETVTLSALRGRPVVFYFYPRTTPRAVPPRRAPCATATARSRRSAPRSMASRPTTPIRIAASAPSSDCPSRCWSTRATRSPISTTSGASARTARWASCAAPSSSLPTAAFVRASYGVKPEDTTPEALAALSA